MDTFTAARPSILQLGQDILAVRTQGKTEGQKRKRGNNDVEGQDQGNVWQRTTRSKSHKSPKGHSGANVAMEDENTSDDSLDAAYKSGLCFMLCCFSTTNCDAEDGLSACPICNQRMKIEDVFQHLDTHQEDDSKDQSRKTISSLGRSVYDSHSIAIWYRF